MFVYANGIQYYASYKPKRAFYIHSIVFILFYKFGNCNPNIIVTISLSNSYKRIINASSSVYFIGNLNYFHLNIFP